MSGVFDDLVGALYGVFSAEVGDTLIGDDDVDGVFRVVDMADHRHDVRDLALFRYRGAREDRDIAVAGEVARAADAVHHLDSGDVGRVDVAEDVGLDGCVHRDDAQTACDFRRVGDFGRTDDDLVAEEVDVVEEFFFGLVAQRQGAGRAEAAFALLHQFDD